MYLCKTSCICKPIIRNKMLSSTTVLLFTSFFLAAFLLVQFSSFIIPTTRQHDPETAAKSERSSRHYQQPMTTATAAIDGEGNEYNKNVIIIHDVASSSSAFHDQIRWLARSADNNEQPVIQPLNAFFEHFMAPDDSIEKPQWERALPTELERGQMRELILFLIRLDNFDSITTDDSFLVRFAPALAPWLQLTFIRQNRYCVVHERLPSIGSSKYFSRLWGYLVLRSPAHCPRPDMHHSAPHFYSEGDVCNQSAAIFERTGSRSLVIAGASRFAVRGFLFRLQAFLPKYALADAAHNNQTMFHAMCTALLEAIRQNQTAIEEANTTFVQWHGMAETSCMETASFLSVGAKGDHSIYADPNSTVNRLVSAVNRLARKKVASTPSRSSHCKLIATSNVFGRIVNGVPERKCCYLAAGPENVKGQFIHIEQKRVLRDNWTLWTSAIEEVFPVRQR